MVILRAGLYERVSTEEQALKGFSIETQIDNLTEYCEKNKIKIVDHYADEGISGAKPPLKRPGLQRLLDDVQAGKIDIIIFTKLDRWFRSVKEYFKVQDILEKHKVEWKAIHEDYDTTTANGRMAITIFLAIAQNEREKTAERIKVVFEHKRKNKEACFGGKTPPMGYKKEKDSDGITRLVKDEETQQMTEEFWDILVKYNNINKAMRYMNDTYGIAKSQKTWYRLIKSEFYCGMYNGVEDFCEPYVSKADWVKIQETARTRVRKTKSNRVYLFSSMMRCPKCGHMLCGDSNKKVYNGVPKEYRSYRCRFRSTTCKGAPAVTEMKVEKYLLNNLKQLLENEIASVELERTKPKPKPKTNIPALKERLRRLNVTYMAGNISDDEYFRDDAEIKALIAKAELEAPPPERDLEGLKAVLETDFETIYIALNDEERQRFWRGLIKEIKLNGNNIVDVIFF